MSSTACSLFSSKKCPPPPPDTGTTVVEVTCPLKPKTELKPVRFTYCGTDPRCETSKDPQVLKDAKCRQCLVDNEDGANLIYNVTGLTSWQDDTIARCSPKKPATPTTPQP